MSIADLNRLQLLACPDLDNLDMSQRAGDAIAYFRRPAAFIVAITVVWNAENLREKRSIGRFAIGKQGNTMFVIQPLGAILQQATNEGLVSLSLFMGDDKLTRWVD